jgi:hypothetical protein
MKNTDGPRWYNAAIVVGVLYFAITVTTGALAAMAQTGRGLFLWRLSAFVFCGLLFLAHIAYEHFRLHSTAKATACHTSMAVVIGALALAVSANMNDLITGSGYRGRMLLALIIWPILTAVPAFIAALMLSLGCSKLTTRRSASESEL